jgi:hypothetical protein
MNPMDVLAPNIMADQFTNRGLDSMLANRGWGVTETMQANPAVAADKMQSASPTMTALRRSQARQSGKTMNEVNF